MLFPVAERVLYERNPLRLVVAQVRFPTVLMIGESRLPDFQERLRLPFPRFHDSDDSARLQIPDSISQVIPPEMLEGLVSKGKPRFQFSTRDRAWTIALTQETLTLETTNYKRWEEFREYMDLALSALVELYDPAFFSRIGLRYQNVIDRRALQLESEDWRNLLEDFILGPLALDQTLAQVFEQQSVVRMEVGASDETVRVEYGLVTDRAGDTSNVMYLIDNDFSTVRETEKGVADVLGILTKFNALNRNLFRFCVSQRLHEAMGPVRAC